LRSNGEAARKGPRALARVNPLWGGMSEGCQEKPRSEQLPGPSDAFRRGARADSLPKAPKQEGKITISI